MKILIAAIMTILSLASCTIETSDNGKLDAYWHLERIDTLATSGSADYSQKRIFWGAQLRLIAINDIDDGDVQKYYARFEQTGDSLKLTKIYENHWHEDNPNSNVGGDIPVETVGDDLRHYGINELPEGFAKERLDQSHMVLRSKTLRLTFRRF